MSRTRVAAHVAALLLACMRADLVGQSAQTAGADRNRREYVLDATMLGYRGVGGEIDGVRNPTLWARPGETVRITMINGETMVHDVVLEKLGLKSPQILDKGATTSITFKASESDTYYCSVPGHRQAGMAGRLEVSAEPRPTPEGTAPAANGRALNLDFENGTLNDWTATGDAFELVKTESQTGTRNGHAGTYWISSAVGGSARKGSLSSVQFTVTHPYASFLVSGGAFDSTRVELVSADTNSPVYSISGADQRTLRPAVVDLSVTSRQGHLRSSRRRRSGGADGDLYQREPVGPHQLRSFSFPRVETRLRERNHARGHHHHAAGGSGDARRPVARGGSPRHERAQGLFGEAGGVGARCRAANRVCLRRPRPAVGR